MPEQQILYVACYKSASDSIDTRSNLFIHALKQEAPSRIFDRKKMLQKPGARKVFKNAIINPIAKIQLPRTSIFAYYITKVCYGMPVKRWNFRKAKWSHYIALRINSLRLSCRLIHLMWMRVTRTSVTPLRKQPKRLSHAGIEITIFRIGMQSVNPSIKPSCSLLRETTQVWLLQLCLPNLTESGGIDGPKQFGALTSHTLFEKRGVF